MPLDRNTLNRSIHTHQPERCSSSHNHDDTTGTPLCSGGPVDTNVGDRTLALWMRYLWRRSDDSSLPPLAVGSLGHHLENNGILVAGHRRLVTGYLDMT
jgi:hypothetical protein